MSQNIKENGETMLFVGRIEYLDNKGQVRFSVDCDGKEYLLKEINHCLSYGIPIIVVLYKDKNGKTISKDFINDLDCMPAGFKIIDYPY